MKKTFYFLLLLFFSFYSCTKIKYNNSENNFASEEIFDQQLSLIFETITFQQKQEINSKDTLFFNLSFFNRNDSNFLQVNYDIGPTFFFFGYKGFLGFAKFNDKYIVVVNSGHDSVPKKFINTDALNSDTIEYKKLENYKYISDGEVYLYHINNSFVIQPYNSAAMRISKKNLPVRNGLSCSAKHASLLWTKNKPHLYIRNMNSYRLRRT